MACIMVIDDQPLVRASLSFVLRRENHVVLEAAGGEEAIALYRDKRPSIVITDIIMPGMDGFGAISELRKFSPCPKIIAVSGGGRSEPQDVLKKAKTLGANATISKPIDVKDLIAAVNELLSS